MITLHNSFNRIFPQTDLHFVCILNHYGLLTVVFHGPLDQPGCSVHSCAEQGEIASLANVKE